MLARGLMGFQPLVVGEQCRSGSMVMGGFGRTPYTVEDQDAEGTKGKSHLQFLQRRPTSQKFKAPHTAPLTGGILTITFLKIISHPY